MILLGEFFFACSALTMLGMAVYCLQKNRASSICFALLSGYAAVAMFDSASLVNDFGGQRYLDSALIYIVGCLSLSLFSWFFAGLMTVSGSLGSTWTGEDFSRHARYAALLGLVSFLLLVAARDSLLIGWNEARSDSGPLTVMSAFCLLLASPGIVSAWLDRRYGLSVGLLMLCGISFAMLGSRAALLGALVFSLWLMLIRAQGIWPKLRIMVVAIVIGFALHVLFRQIRGLGVLGLLQAFEDGDLLSALFDSDIGGDPSGGEADIPKYFLFSTLVSSTQDFGFMSSIQRLAMIAIPRANDWIDKPMDVTYLLWEKAFVAGIFSDAEGQAMLMESFVSGSLGSLHPTLFGELYVAGGWISMLLSVVILGAIFSFIDISLQRMDRLSSLALIGPTLIGYLFVARGNSVIGLGYFFYLFVIFWILRKGVESVVRMASPSIAYFRSISG